MKKLFICVAMALLALACTKPYDDSGIRTEIEGIKYRLDELETNVASIRTTLGDAKFVQKVEKYVDPDTGRITGVTVTYTTGEVVHFSIETVTPYAGPVLSVMKNGAGELCWAIDGVIVQLDGQDVTIYHKPDFAVGEDGHLYVTVDGETIDLGNVRGPKGDDGTVPVQDGIIKGLEVTDEAVIITYDNGTVAIPLATSFQLVIDPTEFVVSSTDPIEIPYTVKNKTESTVVDVYYGNDFKAEVLADKIVVTPKKENAEGLMLAYADSKSGLTSIVKLSFESETFEITDEAADAEAGIDYLVEAEGGSVAANAVSNIAFEVQPQAEWIHFVKTRTQSYVIELSVDENKAPLVRVGTVNIVKAGTNEVVQTITIGQKAPETGAKNLSKKGAANSYIVYESGSYKFWAVKGNSGIEVAPATVEVLWETWNNGEEVTPGSVIASVSLKGSYIEFTTPETVKPGNAVIAAKDAAGVILWSWHIWVPETKVETAEYGIYSAPMMDRNLGALVAATTAGAAPIESFGLTYQWGRKDPFPGPKAANSSSNATVAGVALSETPGAGDADEAKITLEQSIQNPTLLGHSKNGDWITPADLTLWQNDVKTMYDPCPPGYRVPARDKSQYFHSEDLSTAPNWAEDKSQYWFALGNPQAVFPLAGYRDDYGPGEMTHAYDRGAYWSAYSSSDAKAYYVNVRAGSAHALAEAGKSRGGSVRCVAAEETPIFPPEDPGDTTVDLSENGSANSYLVTAAGEYKFKAVKGNSDEAVSAASAEVLWETWNNAEDVTPGSVIASVKLEGSDIVFSTPETLKPGNAVIAAKDAGGAILWSWHIWIPATEVVVWDSEAFCGAKMMDRNLGALVNTGASGEVDPLSIGLYYQWGRKDPFPGAAEFAKSPAGAKVAGEAWTYHSELITTAYSIAHPTEYASVPEVDDGVWNVDDPQDLWNSAENAKTLYDPCPPGYRVPLYDKSLPLWAGVDDGFTFDGNRVSYGDFHFTVAGYLDCWGASYAYSNLRTHIWASKWYDDKRSTCAYFRLDKTPSYYSQKFHKAKAASVRCVVE